MKSMKASKDMNKGKGVNRKDFVNSLYAQDIVKVSQLHIKYVTFFIFKRRCTDIAQVKCGNARVHLTNLCLLYGLNQLYADPAACYESGYFTDQDGQTRFSHILLEALKLLNKRIRPYAIPLIESLDFSDDILLSAIGNSYGDIYEKHLELAKDSRLNHTKAGDAIPDGYMEHIMPILKAKM